MTLPAVVIAIAAVCNFFLGAFVLARDPRKKLNLIFGLFCFSVSVWTLANFLAFYKPSAFFLKSAYGFGVLSAGVSILWGLEITGRRLTKLKLLTLGSAGLLFFIASYLLITVPSLANSSLSNLYTVSLEYQANNLFFLLYFLYLIAVFIALIYILLKGYRVSVGETKKQIGYVLVGVSLNILFVVTANVLMPLLHFYEKYSIMLDSPSSLFLVLFSALAITRHNLFNIKVLLTQILVIIIGLILLILPLLMTSPGLMALTSGLFVFFCFFGYLLIKSALREANYKEVLEREVKNRTKELEKSRDLAEQKTAEILAKKEELEKVFQLTVNRELKMIELKKKIEELKQVEDSERAEDPERS